MGWMKHEPSPLMMAALTAMWLAGGWMTDRERWLRSVKAFFRIWREEAEKAGEQARRERQRERAAARLWRGRFMEAVVGMAMMTKNLR